MNRINVGCKTYMCVYLHVYAQVLQYVYLTKSAAGKSCTYACTCVQDASFSVSVCVCVRVIMCLYMKAFVDLVMYVNVSASNHVN